MATVVYAYGEALYPMAIIIGGSNYAERNVTAGNGFTATTDSRDGIRLEGGAGGHIVKGNFCGTDSTGTRTTGYGNTWAGISINEVSGGVLRRHWTQ